MRDFIEQVHGAALDEPVTLTELQAAVEEGMRAPRAEKHG
jgi:hypothetical protein